jgi:hypothetical protein
MTHLTCTTCHEHSVPEPRAALGYTTCIHCGEIAARQRKHTVLPLHKSNYMVPANREEIKGFNNKGGFHR